MLIKLGPDQLNFLMHRFARPVLSFTRKIAFDVLMRSYIFVVGFVHLLSFSACLFTAPVSVSVSTFRLSFNNGALVSFRIAVS